MVTSCNAFNYRAKAFHGSRTNETKKERKKEKPCKQICTVNLGFYYYGSYQPDKGTGCWWWWSEVPLMINLRDLKSHNKTVNANKSRLNNSTFLSNWLYISRIHSINGSPETNTTPFYSWQTKINISAAAARVRYLLLLLHISTFMADHDHLLSFTDHRMEWKPIFFIANE